MYDKLDFAQEKYEELALKASDPEVISDQATWQKYVKEMSDLEPVVQKYKEYKRANDDLAGVKEMLAEGDLDDEMKELAKMELSELEEQIELLSKDLQVLLLPKDPNDEKNVIVEIRAGAGGDEAALFGSDLLRMYMRYAERLGPAIDLIPQLLKVRLKCFCICGHYY
jgi:peptide chain release factor 1